MIIMQIMHYHNHHHHHHLHHQQPLHPHLHLFPIHLLDQLNLPVVQLCNLFFAFLRQRGGDRGLDMNKIRRVFNRMDLALGMDKIHQIHTI